MTIHWQLISIICYPLSVWGESFQVGFSFFLHPDSTWGKVNKKKEKGWEIRPEMTSQTDPLRTGSWVVHALPPHKNKCSTWSSSITREKGRSSTKRKLKSTSKQQSQSEAWNGITELYIINRERYIYLCIEAEQLYDAFVLPSSGIILVIYYTLYRLCQIRPLPGKTNETKINKIIGLPLLSRHL